MDPQHSLCLPKSEINTDAWLSTTQRLFIVFQTEEQYIFIHDALLEAVTCGETEVPVRSLPMHIQQLSQMDPGLTVTGMELEFKVKKKSLIRHVVDAVCIITMFYCVTEISAGQKRILSVRERQPAREQT